MRNFVQTRLTGNRIRIDLVGSGTAVGSVSLIDGSFRATPSVNRSPRDFANVQTAAEYLIDCHEDALFG